MKLHKESKTIRVRKLDGSMEKRTVFNFNGAKVSTHCNGSDTKTATETYKNYLNNRTHS